MELSRQELIAKVKENNISTDKPPHMTATDILRERVKAFSVKDDSKPTMKNRIFELADQEGATRTNIFETMKEEGYERIRPTYIFVVLKAANYLTPLK
jgi:site-specific DNA-cytosine methylase